MCRAHRLHTSKIRHLYGKPRVNNYLYRHGKPHRRVIHVIVLENVLGAHDDVSSIRNNPAVIANSVCKAYRYHSAARILKNRLTAL